MLDIYFIRHGQTDYNLKNIVQGGGVDSDLNATGREQAAQFFRHYRHIPFQAVYSSELKRTQQTLEPFVQHLGYTIRPMVEFNELNWGDLEGKEATPEIHGKYLEMNREWSAGNLDVCGTNGESPLDGWDRAKPGVEQLIKTHKSGSKLLVCAHGRILRIMLSEILGYGMVKMNDFHHENTGLYHLRFQPNGRAIALKMNDSEHLKS